MSNNKPEYDFICNDYRIAVVFKNIKNLSVDVGVPIETKKKNVIKKILQNYGIQIYVDVNVEIYYPVLRDIYLIHLNANAYLY